MNKTNTIIVRPNGPLQCEGDITVVDAKGTVLLHDSEAWLCRCGASQDKPWCDGAHKTCGFEDAANINDEKIEALESEHGPLTITVRENAMLIIKGPVTIKSQDDATQTTRNRGALCRCGHSANKPFCDVSHKRCGFTG